MLKMIFIALFPLIMLVIGGSTGPNQGVRDGNTGTLEKMIVASGSVAMNLDLNRLNGNSVGAKGPSLSALRFDIEHDSFFTILVFNDDLRGALPSSMAIILQSSATLPAKLNASYGQLVIESTPWGAPYELVVRDGKTGSAFFNIEGHSADYKAGARLLSIQSGT